MRLRTDNNMLPPYAADARFSQRLLQALQVLLRDAGNKVNALADGRISARDGAMTAAPTGGDWTRGDFVTNSAPAEAGAPGSKYVILGWVCVASGAPGTWNECRALTGG